MEIADVGKVFATFGIVSMLATFTVACTAFVVAIVMSVRRQSIVAAWLLTAGWGGAWLVDVGYVLAGLVTSGLEIGWTHWIYLGLHLVTLFFGLITAVALALMKPARPAGRGADHG